MSRRRADVSGPDDCDFVSTCCHYFSILSDLINVLIKTDEIILDVKGRVVISRCAAGLISMMQMCFNRNDFRRDFMAKSAT
jgi:hypothetical protein